jgi:hypothetical protein
MAQAGSASGGQAGSDPVGGTGGTGVVGGTGGATAGTGTGGGTGGTGGGTGGTGTIAGKVILYDGSDATFKSWYPRNGGMGSPNPWTNNADKTMTVKNNGGDIISKMPFSNVFVHVEYMAPNYTYPAGTDAQQRGNSGVYLKGSYEMQVLDTFGLAVANDYCGALYKIAAPLVSACKTGGQWNAYDIQFQANVCTNGTKTANAKFIWVKLNDTLVQQNVAAGMTTQAGLDETCDPRGVLLQDHSTIVPVSFRNIWAVPCEAGNMGTGNGTPCAPLP